MPGWKLLLALTGLGLLLFALHWLSRDPRPAPRRDPRWEIEAATALRSAGGDHRLTDAVFLNDIHSAFDSITVEGERQVKRYFIPPERLSVLKGQGAWEGDSLRLRGEDIIVSFTFAREVVDTKALEILEMEISPGADLQVDAYIIREPDTTTAQLEEWVQAGELSRHARFAFQALDYERDDFRYLPVDLSRKSKFQEGRVYGIVLRFTGVAAGSLELRLKRLHLLDQRSQWLERYPSRGYFTWGYRTLDSIYLPTGCTIRYRIRSDVRAFFDGYLGAFHQRRVTYHMRANGRELMTTTVPHGLYYFRHEIEPEDGEILLEIQVEGEAQDLGVLGNLSFFRPREGQNVIFHLIDALRADKGGLGEPLFGSHFDDGAVFTNAYSNATRTADAIPVIFSGEYKFTFVREPIETPYLQDRELLLAEYLKSKGYVTAAFIGNPWLIKSNSLQGFDYVEYAWKPVGELSPFPSTAVYEAIKYGDLEKNLLEFVRDNRGKRLFVYLHTMETHRPYEVPLDERVHSREVDERLLAGLFETFSRAVPRPRFGRPSESEIEAVKALYRDSVLRGQRFFQRVQRVLQQEGVLDDSSLLILTSDHGERLFEHRSWFHGPPDIFNEVLRVPLMIRGRDVAPGTSHGNVQHADIYPTIIDWFGDSPPDEMVGRSLLQRTNRADADRTGERRIIYADGATPHLQYTCLEGKTKVVIENDRTAVYQLSEDPDERNPIVSGPILDAAASRCRQYRSGFEVDYGPRRGALTDEEVEQLRILGYVE